MVTQTSLTGESTVIDVGELGQSLEGELLTTEEAGYDQARALWNEMIDRRPGCIIRCAGVEDVVKAVRFAATHQVLVAVRGGGHNVSGSASVDGGLVIDLSRMNEVEVDVDRRRVRAGGGATWADVDAATQVHGLATPGGVVSATGIGGLTLGGGLGHLRRKHGLACDNLIGIEMVSARGELIRADEDTDAELLWGLRGGGGNFGVVTRFEYRLHPVGPEVFVGLALHHGDETTEVLSAFRDYTSDAADEISSLAICGAVPAEEGYPKDAWGQPMVLLLACAATELGEGERLLQPFRDIGQPLLDMSGPMPFIDLQRAFDADYPDGGRYYWKSLYLPELSDQVIDLVEEWAGRRPSKLSTVDIWHLGGAISRVAPNATAFGDRSSPYLLGVEANWEDPADDEANLAWARGCIEAFRQASTGREYLNFPGFFEEAEATLRGAYGESNYRRLGSLKRRLDQDNLFRLHHNVPPA